MDANNRMPPLLEEPDGKLAIHCVVLGEQNAKLPSALT